MSLRPWNIFGGVDELETCEGEVSFIHLFNPKKQPEVLPINGSEYPLSSIPNIYSATSKAGDQISEPKAAHSWRASE